MSRFLIKGLLKKIRKGAEMLHSHISHCFDYAKVADFSIRSIQAPFAGLNEFENSLKIQRICAFKRVNLVIIMLLGTLVLQTATVIVISIAKFGVK